MNGIPSDERLLKRLLREAEAGAAPPPPEHADEEAIALFAAGDLPPAQRDAFVAHLADCRECRALTAHVLKDHVAVEDEAAKQVQRASEKGVPAARSQSAASGMRRMILATAAGLLAIMTLGSLYWANSGPSEATAYLRAREKLERGEFADARALLAAAEKSGVHSERLKSLDAQALREIPAAISLERAGRLSDFGYDLGGVVARDPVSFPYRGGLAAAEARLGQGAGNELELLLNRGHLRLTQGNIDAASRDFAAAEKLTPSSPLVHLGKGLAAFLNNDFAGAEQDFRRARELDPRGISAAINLAMTLEERGVDQAAMVIWRELLGRDLPPSERERIRAHIQELEEAKP